MRKNHKSVCAGVRKVENLVCFLPSFDPHFPNIRRAWKRYKIYIESIGKYCKNIESIESMEVTTLESKALPFHFALRPNQFRPIIQLTVKTFSFDLVLTAQFFCVALHQSFGIELLHLEIYSLYICETHHKKVKPLLEEEEVPNT